MWLLSFKNYKKTFYGARVFHTQGVFHGTSERGTPRSPHALGQWEKYFVWKSENDKKTAEMPLKWQENTWVLTKVFFSDCMKNIHVKWENRDI